jgi:hypothetical protein
MTYEEMQQLVILLAEKMKYNVGDGVVVEDFEPGESPVIALEFEGWDLLLTVSLA